MDPKSAINEELKIINKELHNSYERLSTLLKKNRKELYSRDSKPGEFASKNIESVIKKLELKLGELKELGAAHK